MLRPQDIQAHHQANQASMEVILPAQSTGYILMVCESPTLQDHMRKEVETHFRTKDHLLQDYSLFTMRSLVSTLSENLPAEALKGEASDFAVHICYLGNSLLIDKFEGEAELVNNLNEEASALQSAFPFISIIWIDPYSLDYLQQNAPTFCEQALDIYSWWEEKEVSSNSPYKELQTYYDQLRDFEYASKSRASLEIAAIYESQHSFQQAMIHYQRVLEYMQLEEGVEAPLAETYMGMGRIMMQGQDYYQAGDTFRLALDSIDSDNHTMLGDVYRYMGICRHHSNNRQMALSFFRTSNEAYVKAEDQEALALNYQDMAIIYHQAGEHQQAIDQLESAKEIVQKLEDTHWTGEIEKTIQQYQPPKVDSQPPPPDPETYIPPISYDAPSYDTPSYPSSKAEKKKDVKMGRRAFLERFMRRGKK